MGKNWRYPDLMGGVGWVEGGGVTFSAINLEERHGECE